MAFRYANQSDVMHELQVEVGDTDVIDRLDRLENALADAFDSKIGRSFGDAGATEARVVDVKRGACDAVLQHPARSVSSVAHGGTWNGSSWDDEKTLTGWYAVYNDADEIHGLRLNGGWPGSVRVTAVWASASDLAVPGDVSHCLTWLTIRQYRRETSSPQELVGPEGFTIPTPHAWDDPMVVEIIKKYRVVEVIV